MGTKPVFPADKRPKHAAKKGKIPSRLVSKDIWTANPLLNGDTLTVSAGSGFYHKEYLRLRDLVQIGNLLLTVMEL